MESGLKISVGKEDSGEIGGLKMGTYLNPGNSGFSEILKSDYVDKTGLIRLINSTIGTKKKLTCISRPRMRRQKLTAVRLRSM